MFEGWLVTNATQEALAFIGIFLFAISHEFVIHLRRKLSVNKPESQSSLLLSSLNGSDRFAPPSCAVAKPPLTVFRCSESKRDLEASLRRSKILDSLMYGITLILGYLLMAISMTYDLWFLLAIGMGVAYGHYYFSSKSG
jgi:hypothetical protein